LRTTRSEATTSLCSIQLTELTLAYSTDALAHHTHSGLQHRRSGLPHSLWLTTQTLWLTTLSLAYNTDALAHHTHSGLQHRRSCSPHSLWLTTQTLLLTTLTLSCSPRDLTRLSDSCCLRLRIPLGATEVARTSRVRSEIDLLSFTSTTFHQTNSKSFWRGGESCVTTSLIVFLNYLSNSEREYEHIVCV
jgi:hypothetical protein